MVISNYFHSYLPFYKRNLKVALPIVFSQLGGAIVQLVDTFMVGRLGTVELASVSFASAVFVIGFVFASGILIGSTPLIGLAFVHGDRNRVTSLFQNTFSLALLSALVMTCLLYTVSFYMHRMGQDPAVVELAVPYYRILVWSLIPFLFFGVMKQFLEGLGNTKVAMFITLGANVINIILNYFLIYGTCGFPRWGVYGAGFATFISRMAMPLAFITIMWFNSDWRIYFKSFRWNLFSWTRLNELISVGLPIALHILLEVTAFALSGVMVGWLGVAPLAGHQITQNISHMAFMIVLGISSATTIRISHQFGMKDFASLRIAANASIHLCFAANIISALLMIVFRYDIANAFSSDAQVIDIAAQLLIMSAIFQLSDGLQSVGAGILRGLTDVKRPMIYAFFTYICINLPLGYLLAFTFDMGVTGIWTAFIFSLSIAAVLFQTRYRKIIRILEFQYSQTKE